MKTEHTNYGLALLFLLACVGVYFLYGKPTEDLIPNRNNLISRSTAISVCKDVCQSNNGLVLGALKEKGYFADEGTYQTLIDAVNGVCEKDCHDKIN